MVWGWPSGPMGPGDYHGFISRPDAGNALGTVLVFHGNAGSAPDRSYYVAALGRLGYRVILCEYPGYGAREGRPNERSLVFEAHRAARTRWPASDPRSYVWGESLGCGVASALAGDRTLAIEGVVLLTPWDTLPDLAQSKFPFLPARFILRDRYDNIHPLKGFKGRIAVIMAGRDEIIPNRHTRRSLRRHRGGQAVVGLSRFGAQRLAGIAGPWVVAGSHGLSQGRRLTRACPSPRGAHCPWASQKRL